MTATQTKMTLSIAVDGNEANVAQRVGSNVYAFEVIRQLELQTRENPRISWTVFLSKEPVSDFPQPRDGWEYQVIGPAQFWTQWAFPRYLWLHKREFALLYTPGHYAPRLCPIPYVTSVMDLAFLEYPDQFTRKDRLQLHYWTRYSVAHAKKIITISEFSKQEVKRHYHRKDSDVVVAYPGITLDKTRPAIANQFFAQHGIEPGFFLYLGTLQPRKNLIRLIEAYELFYASAAFSQAKRGSRSVPIPQLVIAGKVGWLAGEVIDRIRKSLYTQSIIVTGFVDDAYKHALYRNARATLQVGLYEGFGIPALESLAAGTITIVSDSSSLPEAAGKAGVYVDPLHAHSIAQALTKVWQMSGKERSTFRQRAREQAVQFGWEKTGSVILTALLKEAKLHNA